MMSDYKNDEIADYFSKFANYDDLYYQGPWKHYRNLYTKEVQNKYRFQKNIKILDLGCGKMCSLPVLLADRNVEAYHCVDFSSESIKALKILENLPKVKVYYQNIVDFVQRCEEKYDVVIIFGVLMYLNYNDTIRLFSCFDSILTNNGIILIHEPSESGRKYLDKYGHPITSEILYYFLKAAPCLCLRKMERYNIAWIRTPIYFMLSMIKTILNNIRIKQKGLSISEFENRIWYFEIRLETILAKHNIIGYDHMIILDNKNV